MILGAVLAGGLSRRFGSDKALAEVDGHTLIALMVDTLAGWCDHVIVVGRAEAPAPTLPDWPRPGMGPLSGLAAALRLATDEGYATVLTCGVDSLGLPDNLPDVLGPAPACLRSQPIIGVWPAAAASTVEEILHGDEPHSVYRFAEATGARLVDLADPPANLNTPDDLRAFSQKPR